VGVKKFKKPVIVGEGGGFRTLILKCFELKNKIKLQTVGPMICLKQQKPDGSLILVCCPK
jgi:hypothetical protein